MSELKWERRLPTQEECEKCWLISGGGGAEPSRCMRVFAPFFTATGDWSEGEWLCVIREIEIAMPTTKPITQRLWVLPNGQSEWIEDPLQPMGPGEWIRTEETKTVEVPCE